MAPQKTQTFFLTVTSVSCLFLLLVLTFCSYTASSQECTTKQILSLLEFKKAVDPPGEMLYSWNLNSSACCNWHGIQCSTHGRVIALTLNNCDGFDPDDHAAQLRLHQHALAGELTSSAISAIAEAFPLLSSIDLGCQNLHGGIPVEVGNLTSLTYFDLRFQSTDPRYGVNILTGPISDTLWSLPKLSHIDFGYNYLTGSISELIGNCTSLTSIVLATNNLTGSVPASIANLSSLVYLDISANDKLYGLPHQNWSPSFQLQYLDISLCSFSGAFPAWLSSQTNLSVFGLTGNGFTGEIPPWAWRLASEFLDLSVNQFNNTMSFSKASMEQQPFPSLKLLDVSANQLSGTLPCFIANLTSLATLQLASNSFSGTLQPDFFVNLTSLQLVDLSSNSFHGILPESLGKLDSLQDLDLDDNLFSQTIPPFILSLPSLIRLDLSSNSFHGSIPPVVVNNTNLQFLKLTDNQLTGEIPDSLSSFQNLTYLRLDQNQLTGTIPSSLSLMIKLETIDFSYNKLQGPLPSALQNLSSLVIFNLNNNSIGGAIPSVITYLNNLLIVNLGSCQINGSIPSWIGTQLNQLQVLNLSDNMLTGAIPASLGSLQGIILHDNGTSAEAVVSHGYTLVDDMDIKFKGVDRIFSKLELMTMLDFSGNQLSGQIPSELGNLKGLVALDLSNNEFSGDIPSNIGQLMQLESLDLSRNNLTGQIPNSFGNLVKLAFVNVSNNHLSGSIPSSNQWTDTFTESSFLNNDGLCKLTDHSVAKLPLCSNRSNGVVPPSTSSLSNEDGGLDNYISWAGFAIGYPIGSLLGVMIALFYILKRHRRSPKKLFWHFCTLFERSKIPHVENTGESESLHSSNQEWENVVDRIQQEMNTSVR